MRLESNRPTFRGTKELEILGKNNKNVKYLFNNVNDIVKEHKVPATFEIGDNRIVLSPSTKKMTDAVLEGLKKLGIVITPPKK